ncbi:MAG TPA: energy transducer TonB [Candidatus Saccharimonadales bacterium]|nr:energy transducer TonB [Candidatus Saccharimonadales bacterium]
MSVPSFNHELPAAKRQGFFVWSVAIHVAVAAVLVGLGKWLPEVRIVQHTQSATLLYTPVVETPPPQIVSPPPAVLARITPPKTTPPQQPPEVMPPAPAPIEDLPKPVITRLPELRPPKPKQEVVTGAFTAQNEVAAPVRPAKKEVMTDNFASGSSAPATLQKPAREVQTGGFGDPNGVKGTSEKKGQLVVASLGGFDLPSGPGQGNGSGGARGARGTVASAGFGNGPVGAGPGDRQRNGTVAQTSFTQAPAAAPTPRERGPEKPSLTPVEITYKPLPVYTQEARQLRLEGEVLVRVTFAASGVLRVQQVVQGLGHGLDEAAIRAAQQIRFHPARRNGEPYDSAALVHIVFELAQ